MKHGLYDPRMVDEKVHKPKAVPIGPHVMLDAERCIVCSRCVRFCDEITHTGELGIFQRGDQSEIGLFPGTALENKYSGNVIDICPVGALTDRDFRFQVRVWYLDTAKSVCNGCARGCNIEVHTNRNRPHHNQGRRVARLKPRFNAEVNQWWLCDEGRYGFKWMNDKSRLTHPLHRAGGPDAAGMLRAAREKRLKLLWIFHHDLAASSWPEAEVLAALENAETVIFQGTNANDISARAHLVLPSAACVEAEGTFTNFQGRVQRFRTAMPPLGESWPDWRILSVVGKALGASDPVFSAERAEQVFNPLAAAVPAFGGLPYQALGDAGRMVTA